MDSISVPRAVLLRFERFQNVRIILDFLELSIQKPKVPISQKITWSCYTGTLLS